MAFCDLYAKIFFVDAETKKLLEETLSLARENNEMLKKVRGVQKRRAFFNALKVLFFVGVAVGAFYFVQPYVDKTRDFMESLGVAKEQLDSFLPSRN